MGSLNRLGFRGNVYAETSSAKSIRSNSFQCSRNQTRNQQMHLVRKSFNSLVQPAANNLTDLAPEGRKHVAWGASPRIRKTRTPSPGGAKADSLKHHFRPSGAGFCVRLSSPGLRPGLHAFAPPGLQKSVKIFSRWPARLLVPVSLCLTRKSRSATTCR